MRRIAAALAMSIVVPAAMSIVAASPSSAATLSCAQMKARGYSYARAVDYWRGQGYPSRLDADNNGIPCETVYSATSVRNYWGSRVTYGGDIASGLSCMELRRRGHSYGEALAYWKYEGYPARMDADNNGIPCETVYPASEVRKYFRIY